MQLTLKRKDDDFKILWINPYDEYTKLVGWVICNFDGEHVRYYRVCLENLDTSQPFYNLNAAHYWAEAMMSEFLFREELGYR